jgi:hypothetical protein
MALVEWGQLRVFRKLRRVLWVPIEGTRSTPVDTRRIGTALLWSPSPEEELDLRFDWEELAGMIGACVEDITGHGGGYVMGSAKAYRKLAARAQVLTFVADYRLAPEYRSSWATQPSQPRPSTSMTLLVTPSGVRYVPARGKPAISVHSISGASVARNADEREHDASVCQSEGSKYCHTVCY